MAHSINLRTILEKNQLTGSNYIDWLRNIKIVLKGEKLTYVITEPVPPVPAVDASQEAKNAYKKHMDDLDIVTSIMLGSMNSELQKQHEHMNAPTILLHLKDLFEEQSRTERYEISKALFRCRMIEGTSAMQHGLKMNGYIEQLASLGFVMDNDLSIDLILQSLPDSYASFVLNYQMNKISSSIPELINMLKIAEESVKKQSSKSVMVIGSSSSSKSWRKNKNKKKITGAQGKVSKRKGKAKVVAGPDDMQIDTKCFQCGKIGHWKRNCRIFLESTKKKHGDASTSGIYVIEINTSTVNDNRIWVLDTGCGSHLISSIQGLKNSRKVCKDDVDLRLANGARVAALAVGTFDLLLPSENVLILNDCYYVPALSKNIISISCLVEQGFEIHISKSKGCSIYMNDILYCSGVNANGIYIFEK